MMNSIKVNILWSCIIFSVVFDADTLLVPVLRIFNQTENQESSHGDTFRDHLIVPYLFPSSPRELCSVIYDPNLIIIVGQQYYSYQIEGVPEVTWEYKSDKYYTLVVLGAFQKEVEYPRTTAPILRNLSSTLSPPQGSWHQWVLVNVRRNKLEAGYVVQPYLRSTIAEPNSTHRVIYAFGVYEQPKKFEFGVENGKNTPESLLQTYFTPISNFEKNFNGSILVAGNFLQVVTKPKHLVLDTSVVIYQSRVIITTGQFYFPYQVEGIPEISWDFKNEKFYTVIAIEALQRLNTKVTTTTENIHFMGALEKKYQNLDGSNSTKNETSVKSEDASPPPEQCWYKWLVVDVEENDIETGTVLRNFSSSPEVQPNRTHQIICALAIFEQSKRFELKFDDKDNSRDQLLQSNFTSLSKFAQDFYGENTLIAGNFFNIVPKPKNVFVNARVQKIRLLT